MDGDEGDLSVSDAETWERVGRALDAAIQNGDRDIHNSCVNMTIDDAVVNGECGIREQVQTPKGYVFHTLRAYTSARLGCIDLQFVTGLLPIYDAPTARDLDSCFLIKRRSTPQQQHHHKKPLASFVFVDPRNTVAVEVASSKGEGEEDEETERKEFATTTAAAETEKRDDADADDEEEVFLVGRDDEIAFVPTTRMRALSNDDEVVAVGVAPPTSPHTFRKSDSEEALIDILVP